MSAIWFHWGGIFDFHSGYQNLSGFGMAFDYKHPIWKKKLRDDFIHNLKEYGRRLPWNES